MCVRARSSLFVNVLHMQHCLDLRRHEIVSVAPLGPNHLFGHVFVFSPFSNVKLGWTLWHAHDMEAGQAGN